MVSVSRVELITWSVARSLANKNPLDYLVYTTTVRSVGSLVWLTVSQSVHHHVTSTLIKIVSTMAIQCIVLAQQQRQIGETIDLSPIRIGHTH